MPRPRPPPTPSSSTDIRAQERRSSAEMKTVFNLPPPAIHSVKSAATRSSPPPTVTSQKTPPVSPEDRATTTTSQRKRTLSGSAKVRPNMASSPTAQPQNCTLPPPPSRARKIIQMKPKTSGGTQERDQSAQRPGSSASTKTPSAASTPKRKQPPAPTSAAGRKVARKTAHSIIERRRRSKMNEEFGVLKDMIPACTGVEMHKLAILQAGIEYVRYLEGCIDQLKEKNQQLEAGQLDDEVSMDIDSKSDGHMQRAPSSNVISETDSVMSEQTSQSVSHHHQSHPADFRTYSIATSAATSTYASPNLRPVNSSTSISSYQQIQHHVPSLSQYRSSQGPKIYSTSPPPMANSSSTPTGVSPAFGAFQFSPDPSRASTWSSVSGPRSSLSMNKASPNILPLPQAALPFPLPETSSTQPQQQSSVLGREDHAEATATAALMMLTNDRRASLSISTTTTTTSGNKGMSVKDLLSA